MKDVKKYRCILILLLVHNVSNAMFSATGKRVGEAALPTTRMVRVQPSSVLNPRTPMHYPSWRSTIGSMQLNWQPRRWFSSLKEMFSMKTSEEIKQYKKQVAQENKPLPPTAAHLLHFLTGKRNWDVQETPKLFLESEGFINIDPDQVDKIMAEETKFSEMGFRILYHSTLPIYYALQYINTQLALRQKRIIEGKSVPKNIPLLLRQTTGSKHVKNKDIQQQFLQKGSKSDYDDWQFLLSCNPALTSNLSNPGECTLTYWNGKQNVHGLPISESKKILNTMLEQYEDLVSYIDVFKDRINDSVKKLDASLKTGVLLQLVFKDPILAQESIYVSAPLGEKRSVSIADKKTESILDIMKAFSSPEPSLHARDIDYIQYRVVLTDSLLLDVFNERIYENFEIHAYANPQEALETFHKEISSIMEQIEQEFNNTNFARSIEAELQRQLINFRFYSALSEDEESRRFTSAEIERALEQYQELEKKLKKVQDRNFEKLGLKPIEKPAGNILIPIRGNVGNKILANRAEQNLKEELLVAQMALEDYNPKIHKEDRGALLDSQKRVEKILKDFQEFKRKQFAPSAMEHRPEQTKSQESEL